MESPLIAWGIYLDDNTGGVDVIGNILVRAAWGGAHLHNGRDNLVENNVFVDCPRALSLDAPAGVSANGKALKAAKELGDKLIVIVNNDVQQKLKKGKIIMQEEERLEVVKAMRYVDEAMIAVDDDPTVSKSIETIALRYSNYKIVFGNGGDRKDPSLIPEVPICEKYGITMEFGVGGNDKPNSSSNINRLLGRE